MGVKAKSSQVMWLKSTGLQSSAPMESEMELNPYVKNILGMKVEGRKKIISFFSLFW